MNKDTIGIGVIGCGLMGIGVTREVLKHDPRLRIIGIFDPDERSVKRALQEFNPEPHVYDDYHKLVESPDVDWVMVSSWNCYHADHVVCAFEAGKHVFCQKPLAITPEDCKRMYESWKKATKFSTSVSL